MPKGICPKCEVRPVLLKRSYCRECGNEWQKLYKREHPQAAFTEQQKERIRQRDRERRAEMTPEKRAAHLARKTKSRQAWLDSDPAIRLRHNVKAMAKRKTWTPERLARQRETQKAHYLRNQKRHAKGLCAYSVNCQEPTVGKKKFCLLHWCSTALLAHAGRVKAEYTAEDLVSLWRKQEGKCAITGTTLIPGDNATIDHIVPIAKQGDGTIGNIRFVHVIFNHLKWNLSDSELKTFLRECGPRLLEWSNTQ